jgi:hypothetical protein
LRGDGGGDGGITQVPNVEFVCKSEATTSACSCKKYNIMFLIKAAKNSTLSKKKLQETQQMEALLKWVKI